MTMRTEKEIRAKMAVYQEEEFEWRTKVSSSDTPEQRERNAYYAENAFHYFEKVKDLCLQGIKASIDFQITSEQMEDKIKRKTFNHARDNSISALGKIIKYQQKFIDANSLVVTWLGLLPVTYDKEEAIATNEIFLELMENSPLMAVGSNFERFDHIVYILGEIFQKKFMNEELKPRIIACLKKIASDQSVQERFNLAFNKLSKEAKERIQLALK